MGGQDAFGLRRRVRGPRLHDVLPPPPIRAMSRSSQRRCLAFVLAGLSLLPLAAREQLDRGLVAFPQADGRIYIGWRLRTADPVDLGFDVYRRETPTSRATKLTAIPITDSTNFVDETGGRCWRYFVRTSDGEESACVAVGESSELGGLTRIKFQGEYDAQRVGLGDLDGDGQLDFVIKQPKVDLDPYTVGMAGAQQRKLPPYEIEAYTHDGTFLWRHSMGPNIESGLWYSPMLVYDLDQDGKAEVYCKAGPAEDQRGHSGTVTTGPEYLVKLDGLTGQELARRDWPSRDDIPGKWHDQSAYSYYSRNLMGVAYLDGQRPYLIVQRGTYTVIALQAYDPSLTLTWVFSTTGKHNGYRGSGSHGLQIADIDSDGRDEIVSGAMAIDDNGQPMWTTGRGHPDACYVADIDPDRPGLEVFYGHEYSQADNGVCQVDARTGETLWGFQSAVAHAHNSGFVADIDATRPGMESYTVESDFSRYWLYDAKGTRIGDFSLGGNNVKPVWWTDSTKVLFSRHVIFSLQPPPAGASLPNTGWPVQAADAPARTIPPAAIAKTFGSLPVGIIAIADIVGDWREEVIISINGELQIHSTTIPAATRRTCLMQDRQYRTGVAGQAMGYLYPPILGGQPLPEPAMP